jgi:ATP-dependent DNA helicase RecQ
LSAAVALLRGAKDPRLERLGLDRTPTFGVLRTYREEWLTRLLRRCVTAGWVDFFGLDRPVVALTEEGISTMRAERPVRLLLPPLETAPIAKSKSGDPPTRHRAAPRSAASRSATARESAEALGDRDRALFDALRGYRLKRAAASGVPPYVVASDRTLREIATQRPRTIDELLVIHGIGPTKARRYGKGLLDVVAESVN